MMMMMMMIWWWCVYEGEVFVILIHIHLLLIPSPNHNVDLVPIIMMTLSQSRLWWSCPNHGLVIKGSGAGQSLVSHSHSLHNVQVQALYFDCQYDYYWWSTQNYDFYHEYDDNDKTKSYILFSSLQFLFSLDFWFFYHNFSTTIFFSHGDQDHEHIMLLMVTMIRIKN